MLDRGKLRMTAALAALGISMAFYASERSLEHFVWHLGYGTSAGMLVATFWAVMHDPLLHPLRWPALGYAWMVIPDLLWLATKLTTGTPLPHAPWMDIFLLHVSLDAWPSATLLVLPTFFLAAAAMAAAQRVAALKAAAGVAGA